MDIQETMYNIGKQLQAVIECYGLDNDDLKVEIGSDEYIITISVIKENQ